ncbi:ester cyclase [Endozoicomonas gorgoniicola]|uniref:Ester cyclase n=1 Tax=Endozoicomonas gorgoniicola TaxID=1234144 RepID=A0ABT3MTN9_9GAMM|nr:ester cyclase [Endozoicomonas gorgoniicola]MCW7552448.1 ester cyclase [Endozoicomonas gorgoniicola]
MINTQFDWHTQIGNKVKKLLTAGLLVTTVLTSMSALADEMRKERLLNFYDAFGKGQVEKLDNIIVKDWVTHDPNPGQDQGRDGFKKFIPLVHGAISDVDWKIEEMVEEGNTIVVRSTMTAKHTGPLLGVPATNKTFSIKAIDVHKFNKQGMVTETYHLEDWISYLGQVGALGK